MENSASSQLNQLNQPSIAVLWEGIPLPSGHSLRHQSLHEGRFFFGGGNLATLDGPLLKVKLLVGYSIIGCQSRCVTVEFRATVCVPEPQFSGLQVKSH